MGLQTLVGLNSLGARGTNLLGVELAGGRNVCNSLQGVTFDSHIVKLLI